MKTSLLFKLFGAFLIVIAIGSLVMTVLTTRATEKAFTLYTTRNGQLVAEALAPSLATYYAQNGSWGSVETYLQTLSGELQVTSGGGMMGQGHGFGPGGNGGSGMFSMMGQRLVLANDQGVVVGDSEDTLIGTRLTSADLANGAAVEVNGTQVGTLILTPSNLVTAGTPATDFLSSVRRAVISSAGIAAVIALIIGAALFFQIISPVRKLRKAANAIAQGDLNQRVNIASRDELGALGASFNQMAQNLSNAEIQRKHMIADVAHELRTPLAAMQGTLEGMQDGLLPMDREQVDALQSETALLTRLVNDLRLLSLAEAGELKLELRDVEPVEFFTRIAERARTQAQAREIELRTDLQPNLPDVHIDSDRITQVMNNLVSNAIQYTPRAGTITIGASQVNGSGPVLISVTDTGPGIAPADLPYIFDRFYRADKSRSRSSGGSGLGLAIVKQLIEAHGGTVGASSPIFHTANGTGYGTRVSFTLNTANAVSREP